jgi:Flp pilus assembly protein CpaB
MSGVDMNKSKSNNILFVGVAVFAVGAALAFFGLRSGNKPVAAAAAPIAASTPTTNVRVVSVGPAAVATTPVTFTVPAGKQAVAVDLPSTPGLAGYAQPGDTVNIYATIRNDQPNSKLKTPLTKLILTGVKVLDVRAPAVGQTGNATYLLALDVHEAERVIFFAKFESLWVALTSKDQKPVTSSGVAYKNAL